MAWYRNHYHCDKCDTEWEDEWSCCCDDDCPNCGSRHWSPHKSDDLTFVVEENPGEFTVSVSPRSAEHDPDYREAAIFPTLGAAHDYINAHRVGYWN